MSAQSYEPTSAPTAESRGGGRRPLDGKVVLVLGGAKNLGGHVSRELASLGARVAVHYNSDATASAADETVTAVRDADSDAIPLQADLTDVAQIERTFDAVVDHFGSLYATVNTAGLATGHHVVDVGEAEYDAMMAVNAKAAFFVMREAAKRTEEGGSTRSRPGRWTPRSSGTRPSRASPTSSRAWPCATNSPRSRTSSRGCASS